MPSQVTSQQYGQAVLDHVQSGSYPDSEEVISAELPPWALLDIKKLIDQAKEDVKVNIRRASKESASDIDGWIAQAKQLRVDIQKSQNNAREIVEQARQGERLEEQLDDATKKVDLLNDEIVFRKSLEVTLERLQEIQRTLDLVQRATLDEDLVGAVALLWQVDEGFSSLSAAKSTRISAVLEAKVTDLRSHTKEKLTACWYRHILIDPTKPAIRILRKIEGSSSLDLRALITPLMNLHSYDDVLRTLCVSFESLILLPRLQVHPDGTVSSLETDGCEIYTSGRSSDLSAQALFHDLFTLVDYVRTQLPSAIGRPVADFLGPRLVARLISTWLVSAVPEDLDGMGDFQNTLTQVKQFGEALDAYGWPGNQELTEWSKSIPDVWLRKRQEISLDRVRELLSQGLNNIEMVERIETQVLSQHDEVFAYNNGGDDWNAGWSDEETSPTASKAPAAIVPISQGNEEEDVSAWGLDDDNDATASQDKADLSHDAEEDAEAWGWGNENDDEETATSPKAIRPSAKKTKTNDTPQGAQKAEREVTLRETYNISSLPKEILEIINQVISDAAKLDSSLYASLPIASAGSNLLSFPGLVLAMYRAGSSTTYSRHPSGLMFLYNDSLWLAERLHHLHSNHTTASGKRIPSRTSYNLKLSTHISALETFGKSAYAKEKESQRTIITDLLDGAQGFVHCNEHPYVGACDLAIASTVDRVRQLHREWKAVLSHSVLLQTLGSLLSTITNKIIVDVEDMPDISEEESQQLANYCNRVTALEDLFRPYQEGADTVQNKEQESLPLTAAYTPHWLKFQYLASILESSLIDIKYLWTEGELGLEFDTEELVDLIVALFADTPHRRTAIAEIRARRGVR